ncbi:hypothetical protein [Paenibacillus sp. UNC496MF]|uniref:hypothetical protein n=1 Tax=Paenibacillus sp. UNC496MF TaxID=1502753 RepID=UPI00210C05C1|nr:hypothetical protein [Paenibacillus sp. UNC496MF]
MNAMDDNKPPFANGGLRCLRSGHEREGTVLGRTAFAGGTFGCGAAADDFAAVVFSL